MALEKEMDLVTNSYLRRCEKQEKIWANYNKEEKNIIGKVSKAFREVLNDIEPIKSSYGDTYIFGYEVNYHAQFKEFGIRILNILSGDKSLRNVDYNHCSGYRPFDSTRPVTGVDDEKDQRIKDFEKEYHVRYIKIFGDYPK